MKTYCSEEMVGYPEIVEWVPADVARELLEALNDVVQISDRKHDAWDRAKLAIKHARGES